ncbi:hypothetical protein EVA_19775 [gut metagenome]|uniref:Uncharacterized protein n=1 Tax=gut metagenome TaxID=749906 RepID=J9FRD0_9ZZZZ
MQSKQQDAGLPQTNAALPGLPCGWPCPGSLTPPCFPEKAHSSAVPSDGDAHRC